MLDEKPPDGYFMNSELKVIPDPAGRAVQALLLRLDGPELVLKTKR